MAEEKKVDIAFGGGEREFLPEAKGGRRTDGRDLVLEMRRNGYEIVRTNTELEDIPQWRRPKLLGLFSEGEMAYANEIAAGSEQPALADMTRRAIQLLQWNTGGYLLIVDAGLMRTAARENRGERTLAETVELDRAVAVARSYMGENSTILVAGNLGIGGLSLNGFPFGATAEWLARGQFLGRTGAHLGDRAERNVARRPPRPEPDERIRAAWRRSRTRRNRPRPTPRGRATRSTTSSPPAAGRERKRCTVSRQHGDFQNHRRAVVIIPPCGNPASCQARKPPLIERTLR